jgi:superfamily I DNA/RNA helicase/CRISPR/Cas system-associated exonuclease Cas4 (RecB family)
MSDRLTDTHLEIVEHTGGHLRVLGPPASGKTALLLERFRRLETKGAPAAVVTYTRESSERMTAELLSSRSARFGRVPVYTYHTLAREIAGAAPPGNARVIGEMEESVLLRGVLRRMRGELSSDYRKTLDSTAFQRTILDALHVLFQNGVTDGMCDRLIESSRSSRVADLVRVYAAYRRYLHSHRFTTYYDEAWRAAELVATHPLSNPLAGAGVVLIDDFQDVDPGQYALIRALTPLGGGAQVNVFGDPTGARFRDSGTTDRYLLDVFPREYEPFDAALPAPFAGHQALGAVVGALLEETTGGQADAFTEPGAGAAPDGAGNVSARLVVADDEIAEAAYVSDQVASLLASGRASPAGVAVATREKHKYESVLVRAFRERGLVLDTGRPRRHAFSRFVSSLLRYVDAPGNETARNAFIASPHFAPLRDVYESVAGRPAAGDDNRAAEEVRAEIQRVAKPPKGTFDLAAILETWIKPVLSLISPGEAPLELLGFLGRLADEWKAYVEIVEGAKDGRSMSEFLSLSRTLSGAERSAPVEVGLVGFYSCRELSSRRFCVVYVLGCSELLFPALPSREDYVPYGALQDLLQNVITDRPVELHAARPGDEFLADEYALMLNALTRADEELVLTAPEQHRGTSCPAPSRVLERWIPEDYVEKDIGRSPAPFARWARAVVRDGNARTPAGHRIGDLWNLPAVTAGTIKPVAKKLSPSTIKSYTTCPRKYFYERILRVEEERMPAATFGSLFHDMMKSLSEDHRTQSALRTVIQSGRLDSYVENAVAGSDAYAGATEIVKDAARFHLRDMAERFVELDAARIDDYEIAGVEEWVDFEHDGRPLGGIVDRVDASGKHGMRVVVDYKTGRGVDKTGKTVRKKTLPGFDDPEQRLWQVPLYLRGARTDGGVVPTMFCYYVIRPGDEHYVAGLFVGEEDSIDPEVVFDKKLEKKFAHLTPEELEQCLDEAAAVADEVFGKKDEYVRTSDRDNCRNCYFKRVCERTA